MWKVHPAGERKPSAIAAFIVIILLSGAVYLLSTYYTGWVSLPSFGWAVLSLLILVFALNRFFFPSTFIIDNNGVTARYLFKKQYLAWTTIRRYHHDKYGVYLSTRSRRSWIDAYSGMHILFGHNREDVLNMIKKQFNNKDIANDNPGAER